MLTIGIYSTFNIYIVLYRIKFYNRTVHRFFYMRTLHGIKWDYAIFIDIAITRLNTLPLGHVIKYSMDDHMGFITSRETGLKNVIARRRPIWPESDMEKYSEQVRNSVAIDVKNVRRNAVHNRKGWKGSRYIVLGRTT